MQSGTTQDQSNTEASAAGAEVTATRDAARAQTLKAVLRIQPEELESHELDLAAGMQLGFPLEMRDGKPVFVDESGMPMDFHPSESWADFGRVLTGIEIVTGSHAMYEDSANPEKITGFWFSAHSFFSDTKTEGYDLRETVLTTVAKRLAHDTKYPPGR